MTGREDGPPPPSPRAQPGFLTGRPIDRRSLLRGAARAGLGLGVPAALAGCGEYLTFRRRPPLYAIELAGDPAPGFPTLIADRAHALGVEIHFNDSASPDTLTQVTMANPLINPVNDTYPLDYDLVVVQPNLAPGTSAGQAYDRIARTYLKRGGKLVTYLTPLPRESARITVDPDALAALLVADALARTHPAARRALFIPSPAGNWEAGAIGQAVRATLARLRPGLTLTAVPGASQASEALRSDPTTRMVLCGVDYVAAELAQVLRQSHSAEDRRRIFVGGIGSPAADGQALAELARDDVLRAIAATRLRDLADALVDLPAAMLRGRAPHDVEIAPKLIAPRSPELASFARDYATPAPSQASPFLNPIITSNSAVAGTKTTR